MAALSPAIDLSVVRSDTYFRYSKVTLLCLINNNRNMGITFWRKTSENGTGKEVIPSTGRTGGNELVFELTPRNEGFFFCQNGDEASNVAEVVGTFVTDEGYSS